MSLFLALQQRRLESRLVMMYKNVRGMVPAINVDEVFIPIRNKRQIKPKSHQDCYSTNIGCVRSYANSTIGLPVSFGVQPFITLAYHWYRWLSTGFTIGYISCRRSRAWVKRFTRKNYVIKMEDLKSLAAETSGITPIFPNQMTINYKITIF